MLTSIAVVRLDDLPLGNVLRNHNTIVLIVQPGKYLVRPTVEQPDKSDPLLLVVLELDHIGFQFSGTRGDDLR